jgi:transmembrane sensor
MKQKEKYSDRELEELASLLSDEKRDQSDLLDRYLEEDINNTGKQWKELGNMIDDKKIDVDAAWTNLHSRLMADGLKTENEVVKIRFIRSNFFKIAATVLILLSLGTSLIYMNNNDFFSKKIIVATGNDQKNLMVLLPDGSKIALNRNSVLSYHAGFGKHNRNVKFSGEAFFEIAHDVSKPFIIDAGKAKVKVVGTSFNVISKNVESSVEVFVKTGKVMLTNNSGLQSMFIDPGFVGTMSSKLSSKSFNQNPNYLAWNTGHLVYNGQKLDVVLNDLKKVYNMDIVADDKGILENTWTSPIDNQPQDTIVLLICASFNLNYTKVGNVYHLANK